MLVSGSVLHLFFVLKLCEWKARRGDTNRYVWNITPPKTNMAKWNIIIFKKENTSTRFFGGDNQFTFLNWSWDQELKVGDVS